VTVLEDSTQQVIAYAACEAHGQNGFLTLHGIRNLRRRGDRPHIDCATFSVGARHSTA
jgi:hypothetical protein